MENELLPLNVTEGLPGILSGIGEFVDDAWTEVDAHPGLDDEDRADLTRKFEEIEELVSAAKKIVGVSSEND